MPSRSTDKINILIVDDTPANLVALEAVLANPRYNLVMTSSPKEAFKMSGEKQFAVALIDVQMPVLNGFELLHMIRSRNKSTLPTIFLTAANPSDELLSEGYKIGAVDFLFKPLNPEALKAKVAFFVELFVSRQELLRTTDNLRTELSHHVEEGQKTLETIFSNSPAYMAFLSLPDYRFEIANEEHNRIVGRSDVIGKKISEIFPEFVAQGFIKLLEEVVRTGVPYIGKEVPVSITVEGGKTKTAYLDFVYQPVRRANKEIYGIAVQGYDVTELVLSRKAVENERSNFRNLFRQTPEMVCILKGPNHVFEFVNEAHIKALGFDATGLSVRVAQPDSVEIYGILDDVYRTGKTAELKEIPITVTNRLRYFTLTYAARRDEEGTINGVMVLGVEVTDQVQAIRSRDEFLSIASHELNTPITTLMLQTQIMQKKLKAETELSRESVKRYTDVCSKQIGRTLRLVEDMLDASRITSGKLKLQIKKTHIEDVLSDITNSFQETFRAKGIVLEIELKEKLEVLCDTLRIEQVISNLLTNALRYGENRPVKVTLELEREYAKITVKDQGIGIAPEKIDVIFSRFERVSDAENITGLGLGLYITKKIVEMHGGKIEVISEPGKGSEFKVYLPVL